MFIYLADESLATRLGLEPLLPEKSKQIVKDRFATTFAESLPDSHLWESYFELSIETRKGREFLHSLKSPGASFSDLNLVHHLEHLRRALQRWRRQYYHQDSELRDTPFANKRAPLTTFRRQFFIKCMSADGVSLHNLVLLRSSSSSRTNELRSRPSRNTPNLV